MFGYVRPDKPELKIKDYDVFRSFYCGLCKAIGKRYGQKVRLSLTYDCTFLALLLNSLYTDSIKVRKSVCMLHPFKKKIVVDENIFIDYAADCNVILAYNKFRDNAYDEGKLTDKIGLTLFKRAYKKAGRKFPELTRFIEDKLSEQRLLEQAGCNSIDGVSEPFAQITQKLFFNEELFRNTKFDNSTKKALEWLGYNIGKWVYVADCCDDLRKDFKDNTYNPIICSRPFQENETIDAYKERIKDDLKFVLDYCLAEAGKGMDLLPLKNGAGIIENVIFSGMRKISMEVLQ